MQVLLGHKDKPHGIMPPFLDFAVHSDSVLLGIPAYHVGVGAFVHAYVFLSVDD